MNNRYSITLRACGIALLIVTLGSPAANAANKFRLYDFETGTAGSSTTVLQDSIAGQTVVGTGGNSGFLWMEVPGGTARPLPSGNAMDVVDAVALSTPELNADFGQATYVDVSDGTALDSPAPGSTLALQFTGNERYDDVASGGGSRGAYIDQAAYNGNLPIVGGTNAFESFTVLTQAWVRPSSSAMGTEQTVYQLGEEQGAVTITDDGFWKVNALGPFVPGGQGEYLSTVPVAFDEWTHVAVFRGGSQALLYVNGNVAAGDPNATNIFFNGFANITTFGADSFGAAPFVGLIDDFTMSGFADGSYDPQMDIDYFATIPTTLEVNQQTGAMTLRNGSSTDFRFTELSIRSGTGGLDVDGWLSISDNYDADNDGTLDPTDSWMVTQAFNTELAEAETPMNDGARLAAGQAVPLGDTWYPNPNRDLVMDVVELSGALTPLRILYVDADGNEVDPIQVGDLDFEGTISLSDWNIFVENYGSILDPGMGSAQSYGLGDFDGDLDVDIDDFVTFRDAFDMANGDGAFNRMVPEPTTFGWLAILLGFAFVRCRRDI